MPCALTGVKKKTTMPRRQIIGGLFLYDAFFAVGHVILHRVHPLVFKHLHGKHHASADVRASDTVRLTVVEEAVDVVCSIAALRLLGAHPLSRCIYNIVRCHVSLELAALPSRKFEVTPDRFASNLAGYYFSSCRATLRLRPCVVPSERDPV